MGTKKRGQDSEDEEETSDLDVPPKKRAATQKSTSSKGKAASKSKQKTTKKPKFDELVDETPPGGAEGGQAAIRVLENGEGEKYVDLGKKKRAAVRSFKGQVFVDIREFYGTDGDEKPGKKGISLAVEQWEALKRSADTIDSLFTELGKK